MIAASEPQEFVPSGRQHIKNHPGSVIIPSTQPQLQLESFLVHRLSQVNIDKHVESEWWCLRGVANGNDETKLDGEEELYINGLTAVWSKGIAGRSVGNGEGLHPAGRVVNCSYTTETPITHALWCSFIKPTQGSEVTSIPSICLLDSSKVNVYTKDGEDFISPLQFKVSSVWNTKFGLLLERVSVCKSDTSLENTLVTLFSLLHPLDEMAPLLCIKPASGLMYMNDPCLKIVFTSEDPSMCMMYDTRTGLHSVWKLRKATDEERQLMCGTEDTTPYNSFNHSDILFGSNCSHSSHNFSLPNRSSLSTCHSSPGPHSFSGHHSLSPLSSFKLHSPSGQTLQNTPAPGATGNWSTSRKSFFNQGLSSPRTPPALDARLGVSQAVSEGFEQPIIPELCLEYVWSESNGNTLLKENDSRQANRIFLSTDVLNQNYLCFIPKKRNTLLSVRLSRTNEKDPGIILGSVSSVPAKDAVPLPALQMIAVLDPNGGVVLYTGGTLVGKVLVAGVNTVLASSSYLTSVTSSFTPTSPFQKRSSLLSSTKVGDGVFDESVYQLSPVPSTSYAAPESLDTIHGMASPRKSCIQSLRDPVSNRLTMEFIDGTMFRISLPDVCSSPLVTDCVHVLKCVLPKEVALQIIVKWYATRNAPGTQDISPELEWKLFSTVLFGLLGYDVERLPNTIQNMSDNTDSPVQIKKKRSTDSGSAEDWIYLLNSQYHNSAIQELSCQLGLERSVIHREQVTSESDTVDIGEVREFNSCAPLFQFAHVILFSLHLLYEEMKLNSLLMSSLPLLATMLQQLSRDLHLHEYTQHYWQDFPNNCPITIKSHQISEEALKKLTVPLYVPLTPPNIFHQLYNLIKRHSGIAPYPFISQVNHRTRDMLQLLGLLCSGVDSLDVLIQGIVPSGRNSLQNATKSPKNIKNNLQYTLIQQCVLMMTEMGYTRRNLTTLPAGVSFVLSDAIHRVRESPPTDWPEAAYRLIGRQDLAATPPPPTVGERGSATPPPPAVTRNNQENDDGMESLDREILKLRFSKDHRVSEVRRLLQSSQPVTIAIQQRPEVSDHEFIEQQEKHLYAICTRTMALPVGRGMLTLHTACPVSSEPLPIPRLCLSGRAPPRGTTVDLSHIEVVPNMNLWPLFHNGVAAGLRIAPSASNIDSTWIVYNKPKGGPEVLPEHAGFLMALGLNRHLDNLAELNQFDYLTKCHEMTSVGLLLGIAATKRGTMDVQTTKLLSVHIESLLPPTSIELDIVQNIQVAALLGIGLVYEGTAHRHIAEVLLSEMGRPPGPEMENSVDRESYALAAGLGLGFVVLGRGSDLSGLNDLGIADKLHYYMIGGYKRSLTGSQKEKYKSPSYQIQEGDSVNIDVTSPGATLALGMMYFRTGNRAVANWMKAPDTQHLLDFVCPDFLLLRMVARGLILWDEILPTTEWVESNIPDTIKPYWLVKPRPGSIADFIDSETMNQAYCNILAGACMAMGLRFAGSANNEAFNTLFHYCKMLTSVSGKSISMLAGASTIETCLNVVLLSLSMVMAGTGDLSVLRICRFLHSRVGQPKYNVVTYGSHLASHMALGLLFLGGGRYTLMTSPTAVAAMLCAFFPKFPTHSNDNRYHLQAFRHLYVLAAESRLLLPRDIDTGSLCYAHVTVLYLDTTHYQNQSVFLKAPCILPELKFLKEVRIDDNRYWTIVFKRGQNWNQLQTLLGSCVGVKQHAGCLSYLEDPHGFRSLLAQTLTTDKAVSWSVPAESILAFSSDPSTVNFAHYFLEQGESTANGHSELQLMQFLTKLVYECVTHDKLSIVPLWIIIIKAIQSLYQAPCGYLTWQLKLLIAQGLAPCDDDSVPLVSPDLALSISQQVTSVLDSWESELSQLLQCYLHNMDLNSDAHTLAQLATYLTFHEFPPARVIKEALSDQLNPLMYHMTFQKYHLPFFTINKIASLSTSSSQ